MPFAKLFQLREFERRNLHFLESSVDLDIVISIGHFESKGDPLTLTRLYERSIASPATVERRLARLKRLGVVVQQPAKSDRRMRSLHLSPRIRALYRRSRTYLSHQ